MAELDSQPKSVQSLYSWYGDGLLWVNRRYQRKLVWTLEEKQKLVESVLKRYPIPAVLLAERDDGGYEVIDGLQRIHTLMSFIEQAFPTLDQRFFAVTEFPTANTRASEGAFSIRQDADVLSAREVGTFLDYSLAVSVMRGATQDEIDDVFGRINTYGHRLSDQERRQAGVQNTFSAIVREIACELRGDVSRDELGLLDMPSISIDLPMSRQGYVVSASEVFWVEQGVLRSTDLRDSMDEQCIADIAACIVGHTLIDRSKDALDEIYRQGSDESQRIENALQAYGGDKLRSEFKFVIDEIGRVVNAGERGNLRDLLFRNRTTNPFPALFTVLFLAVYESLIIGGNTIVDYAAVRSSLDDLNTRVDTSRGSTAADDRRTNINVIKGLIGDHLAAGDHRDLYGDATTFDIDESVRRSEIEMPDYELKQGILRLDGGNQVDNDVIAKVLKTICAIANNGRNRDGRILVGVADVKDDADRIEQLHGVRPKPVGRKWVVGVKREADALSESAEAYVARFRNAITAANMSPDLKASVLASLSYADYLGYGILQIRIPGQAEVSLLDDRVYVREGDQTVEKTSAADLLTVARRFQ